MVHVKKCPRGNGKRGKPTTEFHHNGKAYIYCYGWIDMMCDEPLDICKNCLDWAFGEQVEKDMKRLKEVE